MMFTWEHRKNNDNFSEVIELQVEDKGIKDVEHIGYGDLKQKTQDKFFITQLRDELKEIEWSKSFKR